MAAGYTTLACYVAYSIGHYFVSKKVLSKYMNGKSLFDVKTILFISIVLIGSGIGINYLFSYRVIRYGILTFELLLAYIFRKQILQIFKRKEVVD